GSRGGVGSELGVFGPQDQPGNRHRRPSAVMRPALHRFSPRARSSLRLESLEERLDLPDGHLPIALEALGLFPKRSMGLDEVGVLSGEGFVPSLERGEGTSGLPWCPAPARGAPSRLV